MLAGIICASKSMPMIKALKFVSLGLVIVLSIAVLANIPHALTLLEDYADTASTSVLTIERGESAEDVALSVLPVEQSTELEYGSRAEVYRFKLSAEKAYALRYLSFNVSWDGLNDSPLSHPTNWHLFLANENEVDYLNEIGTGEKLEDDILKMRVSQKNEAALFLPQGEVTFVLTTNVLRDYDSDIEPWIEVFMPTEGYFGWTHNLEFSTWMTLEEKFGAELIEGLPSEVINRS
jgi:hypothetical protein